MVDDERIRRAADAAEVMVARQDPFPAPAEAGPRAPAAVVAPLAEPAAVELPGATGAAERELLLMVCGHERSAGFLPRAARRGAVWAGLPGSARGAPPFTCDKRHYHNQKQGQKQALSGPRSGVDRG